MRQYCAYPAAPKENPVEVLRAAGTERNRWTCPRRQARAGARCGRGAGSAQGGNAELSRSSHRQGRLRLASEVSAGAGVRRCGRGRAGRPRRAGIRSRRPRHRQFLRKLDRRRAQRSKDARSPRRLGRRRSYASIGSFRSTRWSRTPEHLSDIEAAALPCAGVTAWSAVSSSAA